MSESNLEFVNKCLAQWKGEFSLDERLKSFSNRFDEWLEQIPEESRDIVKILIYNMSYYSNQSTNKWLEKLHKDLLAFQDVTDENTIYAFIKSKDGKSNSSNDYWTNYKAINRINSNLCFENLDLIRTEDWAYISNIIFIDDFSGTGKTFIDEIKKQPSRYFGKRVFFIVINIMQLAIDEINKFAKESGLEIVCLAFEIQSKAFERNLFADEFKAKANIEAMSKGLGIPTHHILGYKGTESLVAFYNNTPNNTLGFIRYDTENYRSIFPRRNDPKPSWQMVDASKKRKAANYNNKVLGNKK